jgi:transcriptional regulator with XRE-family HTH domain
MTVSANVGQHMRRWRGHRERPQRFLVRLVNDYGLAWSQSVVSQIELGHRHVTVDELAVLAIVLGQQPCQLLEPITAESEPEVNENAPGFVSVGDQVVLPRRYQMLAGTPGEVVKVEDGWAMVDCGSWGIFGMPAEQVHDDGDAP